MEGDERLEADGGLLVLELLQGAERVWVYVELEHVEDLVVVGADEGEAVGALFGVEGEDEEGGVVFEGEELEGLKGVSFRKEERRVTVGMEW